MPWRDSSCKTRQVEVAFEAGIEVLGQFVCMVDRACVIIYIGLGTVNISTIPFKDTVSLIAFAIRDVGTVMALSQWHVVESCNLARTG
jgi:hypothetical protein